MFILILLSCFLGSVVGPKRPGQPWDCSISPNRDLSDNQPLILSTDAHRPAVLYPNDVLPRPYYGALGLDKGSQLVLLCPGSKFLNPSGKVFVAKCSQGTSVTIANKDYEIKHLSCKDKIISESIKTGQRCTAGEEMQIGFNIGKKFLAQIDICFSMINMIAVYSVHTIVTSVFARQRNYPKSTNFQSGDFYKRFFSIPLVNIYSFPYQADRFRRILGAARQDQYFNRNNGHYFIRGHLAPRADFVYGVEQSATYHYLNVIPQWDVINGGVWKSLESHITNFVSGYHVDIKVYTGTHGILKLKDGNGRDREIYLYQGAGAQLLPVPLLMYKILHSPSERKGVACITINNPHFDRDIPPELLICRDTSKNIPWLRTFNGEVISRGYTYCCYIKDALRTFTNLPPIIAPSLLT